jgi:hypothetical protein
VEAVLLRALAKDPNQRYQSAAEMAAELNRIAGQFELDKNRSQAAPAQPITAPIGRAQAQGEQVAALQDILRIKNRRLHERQLQAATFGPSVDPAITIEIEDLESEISDLENHVKELAGQAPPRATGLERMRHTAAVVKRRRIDAAIPSRAEVGQRIDLIVQVRFPNSRPLGIKDWPTHNKPAAVEQVSESVGLSFKADRATGELEPVYLEVRVVAPDFTIEGTARQRIEVPADEYSKRVIFLLTSTKAGIGRVNVEVYGANSVYMGTIAIETDIGGARDASTRNIANMQLDVMVHEQPGPELGAGEITCVNCGRAIQAQWWACPYCGHVSAPLPPSVGQTGSYYPGQSPLPMPPSISPGASASAPPPSARRSFPIWAIVAVVVLLAVGCFFLMIAQR